MKLSFLILSFALLLVGPAGLTSGGSARADSSLERAKSIYDKAETSYALGKFEEALNLYEQAYETKPLAAFLFNIGQCHRNLGNYERAGFFYSGYLSKDPKAKNRAAVLALIDQMDQKLKEEREKKAALPTETPPVATQPTIATQPTKSVTQPTTTQPILAPPPTDTAANNPLAPPPPPRHSTPVYKKWWVWTLVGVVVAGGVAGGVGYAATHPSVNDGNLNTAGSLRFDGGPINVP